MMIALALLAGGLLLALGLILYVLTRPHGRPAAERHARRRNAIVEALKGLPLIAFALMLGGGLVASAFVAWGTLLIDPRRWLATEAVQLALIDALKWQNLAWVGVVCIVMVALAWGKVKSISASLPGGASISATVDDDDAPPPAAKVVTTTTVETPPEH